MSWLATVGSFLSKLLSAALAYVVWDAGRNSVKVQSAKEDKAALDGARKAAHEVAGTDIAVLRQRMRRYQRD